MIAQLLTLALWTTGIALAVFIIITVLSFGLIIRLGYGSGLLTDNATQDEKDMTAWYNSTVGASLFSITLVTSLFFLLGLVSSIVLFILHVLT